MTVLFLDFDGVLHPEVVSSSQPLLCQLPLLEVVLQDCLAVEVVISSTWRLRWPDPAEATRQMRQYFSADIAARVVGVTPQHRDLDPASAPDGLDLYLRHWECEAWLRAHRPPGTPWIALDDRAYWFRPFCPNLLALDPRVAFTLAHADELRQRLKRLAGPAHNKPSSGGRP